MTTPTPDPDILDDAGARALLRVSRAGLGQIRKEGQA